jgi:hypothetical protein
MDHVSYFFGGLFLANAVPHFFSGAMGMPFQSPFAKPPGEGLSSSRVNVAWGIFNILAGYFLVFHVGAFDIRNNWHFLSIASGATVISFFGAWHFGKFHGGNLKG